jgi:hypothetical protein
LQQALRHANGMPWRQAKQALDAQAERNGFVIKGGTSPLFAAAPAMPIHGGIEPDQQRATRR